MAQRRFDLMPRNVGRNMVLSLRDDGIMAYLVRKRIDGTVIEEWEVTDKPLIFGRGEQVDVRIVDERMSRQHFVVAPKGDGYVVQDLKSTNGTYVNNDRITEQPLKPNDRIRAGHVVFVFLPEKPKGMATIMSEIEAEGKGYKTVIREMSKPAKP
jgi:pSer/pThr/pTyr-binding forkhead associated (FHA) protein